jgi:hypothetical protein
MNCIFGLTDPTTHEVKFVGRVTLGDLSELEHWVDFWLSDPDGGESKSNRWQQAMRDQDLRPGWVVFEKDAPEGAKREWINRLVTAGAELVNTQLMPRTPALATR